MLVLVMFRLDEVTLITGSNISIWDIEESIKFKVDKNRLNNEYCCMMLDEFWTVKEAEIKVNRVDDDVAK